MIENIANFCVELKAVFNDGGLKEMYKSFTSAEENVSAMLSELEGKAKKGGDVAAEVALAGFTSLRSGLEEFFNFTSKSFLDLNTLMDNVWNNMVAGCANALSKIMANGVMDALFGGEGVFGGVFGGLLGSRRSGGPIDKTGPYYLHEGEFVLPPEVVGAIRGGGSAGLGFQEYSQKGDSSASAGVINITVNTPLTVNGFAERNDAQKLCEEISRAARRGVSWAVEQAKISYKIGRDRSGESAL